jgi:hypothetical protein
MSRIAPLVWLIDLKTLLPAKSINSMLNAEEEFHLTLNVPLLGLGKIVTISFNSLLS